MTDNRDNLYDPLNSAPENQITMKSDDARVHSGNNISINSNFDQISLASNNQLNSDIYNQQKSNLYEQSNQASSNSDLLLNSNYNNQSSQNYYNSSNTAFKNSYYDGHPSQNYFDKSETSTDFQQSTQNLNSSTNYYDQSNYDIYNQQKANQYEQYDINNLDNPMTEEELRLQNEENNNTNGTGENNNVNSESNEDTITNLINKTQEALDKTEGYMNEVINVTEEKVGKPIVEFTQKLGTIFKKWFNL